MYTLAYLRKESISKAKLYSLQQDSSFPFATLFNTTIHDEVNKPAMVVNELATREREREASLAKRELSFL